MNHNKVRGAVQRALAAISCNGPSNRMDAATGVLATAMRFVRTFDLPETLSDAECQELAEQVALEIKYTAAVSHGRMEPVAGDVTPRRGSAEERTLDALGMDYADVIVNPRVELGVRNMTVAFEMF